LRNGRAYRLAPHPSSETRLAVAWTGLIRGRKSLQLDMQTLHRVRDQLVGERTSLMNQIRSLLLERGHVIPQVELGLQLGWLNFWALRLRLARAHQSTDRGYARTVDSARSTDL
jgi:transposase